MQLLIAVICCIAWSMLIWSAAEKRSWQHPSEIWKLYSSFWKETLAKSWLWSLRGIVIGLAVAVALTAAGLLFQVSSVLFCVLGLLFAFWLSVVALSAPAQSHRY